MFELSFSIIAVKKALGLSKPPIFVTVWPVELINAMQLLEIKIPTSSATAIFPNLRY